MEPGTAPGTDPDGLEVWLRSLTTGDLSVLVEAARAELLDRAAGRGDLDAVVERAFAVGFDHRGAARLPWLEDELVVCPGSRIAGGAGSHRCRFVACGDVWAWQSEDAVADEMRPHGADLRTVTVLAARPGLEFDVVTSDARRGVHRRRSSVRLRLDGDGLVEAGRQGAGPGRDHR